MFNHWRWQGRVVIASRLNSLRACSLLGRWYHCVALILVHVGTWVPGDIVWVILTLICHFHFSGWNIWECRWSWAETNLWRTESYSSRNQAAEPPVRYDPWWTEKVCLFLDRGDVQERGRKPGAAWPGELSKDADASVSLWWRRVGKKGSCGVWSCRVWAVELVARRLFFPQITQQELDTVVNTQHEILRQVNEMK